MTQHDENTLRFTTKVDLPTSARTELVQSLNVALATTSDLRSQVKQAHWNIKGAQFVARHELFDELAGRLIDWSDDLAERATTLGGYARGTARLASELSMLPEYDLDAVDGTRHLDVLINRYGAYCGFIRKMVTLAQDQKDPATEDLYTEILRTAEKDLWFLEAHRAA